MFRILSSTMKQNFVFYLLALIIVFALKLYYSQANSEELDWILRPTAGMVEAMSGVCFEYEKGVGYISQEHYLLIAPSCAGVNFLIAAFCVAIYSFTHTFHSLRKKMSWFIGNIAAVYLLTLFVNSVRILFAIALIQFESTMTWLTPQQIHRLEGIIIYFGFLCTYSLLLQGLMTSFSAQKPCSFRLLFGPLTWYLTLTVFVPLFNPVSHTIGQKFFEHGGFVLVGCAIVLLLMLAFRTILRHLLPCRK